MTNTLRFRHRGYLFGISGDYLHIGKDGIALVELYVAPVIEGKATRLCDWCEVARNHLAAHVEGVEATVHLRGRSRVRLLSRGNRGGSLRAAPLSYRGAHHGAGWQTYLSDVNDCFRSCDVDAEVPISSCFNDLTPDEADGEGMTDPGDVPATWIWNVPIRALSLHTECGLKLALDCSHAYRSVFAKKVEVQSLTTSPS